MNKNHTKVVTAFTLVELLVGVTISILIMMGVGVFISSGIGNLTYQQQQVEKKVAGSDFLQHLQERFSLAPTNIAPIFYDVSGTREGVLMRVSQKFGEGGMMYIGTTQKDDYCGENNNGTDYQGDTTEHVFIKTFYPFLENGEDFDSNMSDIINASDGGYFTSQKEHHVKHGPNIEVGVGLVGEQVKENNPLHTFLNHPTGVKKVGDIIYISDTGNNRILKYDVTGTISILLDSEDGLNEPVGLYVDSGDLYIANAGSGEILKYSDVSTIPEDTGNITLTKGVLSVASFSLSFVGGTVENLDIDIGDVTFSGSQKSGEDFAYIDGNSLHYYFINNYSSTNSCSTGCSGSCSIPSITTSYIFDTNPKKQVVTCDIDSSETTEIFAAILASKNFSSNNTIALSDISGNFESDKNYYLKLEMFDNSGNSLYENYYPFYSPGKNLEVVESGLNYPTSLSGTTSSPVAKELPTGTFSTEITYDPENDILLDIPVENFSIDFNTNKLSVDFDVYKNFDCYNKEATENGVLKEVRLVKQY